MMKIALYKGPPSIKKDFVHWISHWAICARSFSKYSHVELVIDGQCYSSSSRDGGVRSKIIDLNSGKWDVVDVEGDEQFALAYMIERLGNSYDWWGIVRFIIPFVPQKNGQEFCSEIVAGALGAECPEDYFPADCLRFAK
jgi:hypothetical protein